MSHPPVSTHSHGAARRLLLAFVLALAAASAIACGSDGAGCTADANDLNGEYYNATYDLEMVLVHDCGSGMVAGTFYDNDSFAYELTGTVTGDEFDWDARRDLPGGGSDHFYSHTAMDILNNGLSFSGRVLKNGAGPAGALTFELQ